MSGSTALDLIDYRSFDLLRLGDFLAPDDPKRGHIHSVANWEYMGGRWIGEGLTPFTTFMRPEHRPDEVGAIELDLEDLDEVVATAILRQLRLPVRPGATRAEIDTAFGPPVDSSTYVDDRITLEFEAGMSDQFRISLTVHHLRGLIHITMIKKSLYDRLINNFD